MVSYMRMALFALILVSFALQAAAKESELVLNVNAQNKLFAEKVFDDLDGSINIVDVCILRLGATVANLQPTKAECYTFENVIEGQVLDIPFQGQLDKVSLAPEVVMQDLKQTATFAAASCAAQGLCTSPDYGNCVTCPSNYCGNSICAGSETCQSCPFDCGICPSAQTVAAYYNFVDFDGQVTNAKFLIYATKPTYNPAEEQNANVPAKSENVIELKSLAPVFSEDRQSYTVQARIKTNPVISVTGIDYFWSINGSDFYNTQFIPSDDGLVATIGPFQKPVLVKSFARANILDGSIHLEAFNPRAFFLILPDADGKCKTAAFSSEILPQTIQNNSNANELLLQNTSQTGWSKDVSRIWILPAGQPGKFKVVSIQDGDQKIDFLNIFITGNGKARKYNFQNVAPLQNFLIDQDLSAGTCDPINCTEIDPSTLKGLNPNSGKEIFYSFMDSDFGVGNINVLLPLNPDDALDEIPQVPSDRKTYIDSVVTEVVPSEDCTNFKIRFTAKAAQNTDLAKVFMKYGFQNYSLAQESPDYAPASATGRLNTGKNTNSGNEVTLELQGSGGTYEGEVGPFGSVVDFFSRIYAQGTDGSSSSWQNFFSWFGVGAAPGAALQPKDEICGNKIDDNLNGSIDEGCVVLPDLLFVGQDQLPAFVAVGDPIFFTATIKNAGIINTSGFSVSLLMNEKLAGTLSFDSGLAAGEEQSVNFIVPDSTGFLGLNNAKIVIDPEQKIPELNRQNNELAKSIAVGYNSFNMVLNFNNADLLGDLREFRAFGRSDGKPQPSVKTLIKFPSGKQKELLTGLDGINNFVLTESGTYVLTAVKDKFDAFEATFLIPKINVLNLKPQYDLGSPVSFLLEADNGKKISDAVVEVIDPNTQITTIKLSDDGSAQFLTKVSGSHEIRATRKGVPIFTGNFLVSGGIESTFIQGGLQKLLFGSIASNPPLFMLMALLCLAAGIIAFSKSRLLFKPEPKSTRQEQIENIIRMFIGIVFFLLPFQATNYFGFSAGLIIVILEAGLAFALEYTKKTGKKKQAVY